MERLPILAIVAAAVQRYRQLFPDLMRVIALPALAHAVILYVWFRLTANQKPLFLLLWVAQGFLMTLAAHSCHRVILLGPESVPPLGSSGTAARDWRFLCTAVALFVTISLLQLLGNMAIFIPLSALAPNTAPANSDLAVTLTWLTFLPALYVTCRYAVCLPAAAVDRRLLASQAWQLTQGHGLRLLLLVGIAPWLFHLVQRWLASSFSIDADYIVAANLLFWLFLPLEIALLSVCYQRLSRAAA
ncbi:hypothetical protein [Steroidobacter sp.]|uniref:hypothetical protein n=1 Tax=Steroidobacter sp. TaxID=1978227 RepID=UPI001A3BA888|nr:hypothetical protein [Steroidobacter sp.]MBL8271559.1 hypothetical protein [Steroidobacter sp.]